MTDTGFLFEEENIPALPLPTPAPLPATTPASTRPPAPASIKPPSSNKPPASTPASVKPPAFNKVPAPVPEQNAEDYTGIFLLIKTFTTFMMTFLFLFLL